VLGHQSARRARLAAQLRLQFGDLLLQLRDGFVLAPAAEDLRRRRVRQAQRQGGGRRAGAECG
jgi:hypothetical protein